MARYGCFGGAASWLASAFGYSGSRASQQYKKDFELVDIPGGIEFRYGDAVMRQTRHPKLGRDGYIRTRKEDGKAEYRFLTYISFPEQKLGGWSPIDVFWGRGKFYVTGRQHRDMHEDVSDYRKARGYDDLTNFLRELSGLDGKGRLVLKFLEAGSLAKVENQMNSLIKSGTENDIRWLYRRLDCLRREMAECGDGQNLEISKEMEADEQGFIKVKDCGPLFDMHLAGQRKERIKYLLAKIPVALYGIFHLGLSYGNGRAIDFPSETQEETDRLISEVMGKL